MDDTNQKFFGIGLSKTGTTSLAAALNRLGIRTNHEPYTSKETKKLIRELGKLPALDSYQSITNHISWDFEFLDRTYPNSKFILTARDIESWLKSKQSFAEDRGGKFEYSIDETIGYYKSHYLAVTKYFKYRPDDFLIMNIIDGDGWDKLCPFLGLAVPGSPFPRENVRLTRINAMPKSNEFYHELATVIEPGSSSIFVDLNSFPVSIPGNRPFLESNGEFWGLPSDSAIAIEEIERMRQDGCDFIVFPWTSFWWFDYNGKFNKFVRGSFSCIAESELSVIFDMRRVGP